MGDLPNTPSEIPVKFLTVEEIYAAKEARRKYLAKLPIDQKIDLIEQLHEFGKTMIEARKCLSGSIPSSAPRTRLARP
jgi:hypothetical protein